VQNANPVEVFAGKVGLPNPNRHSGSTSPHAGVEACGRKQAITRSRLQNDERGGERWAL